MSYMKINMKSFCTTCKDWTDCNVIGYVYCNRCNIPYKNKESESITIKQFEKLFNIEYFSFYTYKAAYCITCKKWQPIDKSGIFIRCYQCRARYQKEGQYYRDILLFLREKNVEEIGFR